MTPSLHRIPITEDPVTMGRDLCEIGAPAADSMTDESASRLEPAAILSDDILRNRLPVFGTCNPHD